VAEEETGSKPVNCWEYMKCGRERGGTRAHELGICPAYPLRGRSCARVGGTLCGGKVQGTFASKLKDCRECPYYKSEHYVKIGLF